FIHSLSLHDALPISFSDRSAQRAGPDQGRRGSPIRASRLVHRWSVAAAWALRQLQPNSVSSCTRHGDAPDAEAAVSRTASSCARSEEHTSELQSPYE